MQKSNSIGELNDSLLDLLEDDDLISNDEINDASIESVTDTSQLLELLEDDNDGEISNSAMQSSTQASVSSLVPDLSDILDDTYEQEVQNTGTYMEFTEDYSSHFEDSAAISIDFDTDMDDSSKIAVEEDVDSEDVALITTYSDELAKAGYRYTDRYDYEGLQLLYNFEQEQLELSDIDEKQLLLENFAVIKESIMSSTATYVRTGKKQRLGEDIAVGVNTDLPDEFANKLLDIIEDLIYQKLDTAEDTAVEITPNNVITALLDNESVGRYSQYLQGDDCVKFLQSAIPVATSIIMSNVHKQLTSEAQREKVTSYLLRKEIRAMNRLKDSNYATIKQVFKRGKSYVYNCTKCDHENTLTNKNISFIAYATESNGHNTSVVPELITCENCQTEHMFPIMWYLNIAKGLRDAYESGISDSSDKGHGIKSRRGFDALFTFLNKTSIGTAITIINPPIDLIMQNISPILELETSEEMVTTAIVESADVQQANVVFNDLEYKAAIADFYRKLLLFEADTPVENSTNSMQEEAMDISDLDTLANFDKVADIEDISIDMTFGSVRTNRLSYRDMALCMMSELSRDYKVVKNKALYSLLMFLNDYSFFRDTLNSTVYNTLQNKETILKNVENLNSNDVELIEICKEIYNNDLHKDFETLAAMKEDLTAYRKNLADELMRKKAAYDEMLTLLEGNTDLLGYVPIINVNQISYSLLLGYVPTKRVTALIDEVTDRMIVNCYAEEFSTILFKGSQLKTTSLYRDFLRETSEDRIADSLKRTDENKSVMGVQLTPSAYHNLSYVSTLHLVALQDAATAYKECSYYNFIKALCQLQDTSSLINDEVDSALNAMVQLARQEEASFEGKSYFDYYFPDFNKEDFSKLDSAHRSELTRIVFGRYVPKRVSGESLSDYINRYNNKTCWTADDDCHDFGQGFIKFEPYYLYLLCTDNMLKISTYNFVISNVIRYLLHMCINTLEKSNACAMLGFSENYFRRLNAITDYRFSDMYSSEEDMNVLLRVLYGYYVGSCDMFLEQYRKPIDEKAATDRSNVCSLGIPNVQQILQDLECTDDTELQQYELEYVTAKKNALNQTDLPTELESGSNLREDYYNEILQFSGGLL